MVYKFLSVNIVSIKELILLQRCCLRNLNQVTAQTHTDGVYPEEIDGLRQNYEKPWDEVSKVLRQLSKLVGK